MKRELRRIEPWSAVRISFLIGLLGGFLFGLFNGVLVKYMAGVLGDKVMPPELMSMAHLTGGAIFALAIIMALMSSLLFAVLGLIAAFCYNVIAHLFGGLEIDVIGHEPSPAESHASLSPDEEEGQHE